MKYFIYNSSKMAGWVSSSLFVLHNNGNPQLRLNGASRLKLHVIVLLK